MAFVSWKDPSLSIALFVILGTLLVLTYLAEKRGGWRAVREKVQRTANRLLYGMPDRYGHLTRTIEHRRCRRIMEIGVWDAVHSRAMIQAALRHHPPESVAYYGFDLFEQANAIVIAAEISKPPPSLAHIRAALQPFVKLGVTIHLVRGDTKIVLPQIAAALPPMDFVFIDGGHSEGTVRNDWTWVQRLMGPATVVIFDDTVDARSAEVTGVGVNAVLASIDADRYVMHQLRPVDTFRKPWGTLHIALTTVTRRRTSEGVARSTLFPALAVLLSGPRIERLHPRVPLFALALMTGLLGTCVHTISSVPESLGPRVVETFAATAVTHALALVASW